MEAEAAAATAADLQARLGELQAATKQSGEDAARLKALGERGDHSAFVSTCFDGR